MVIKRRTLLTEIRKAEGSQESVAEKLKISRQLLSMIEIGQRNPNIKLMLKMSRYFGIQSEKLFPDLFFDQECHKMKQNQKTA
ncbi:helix-turn-helix transcriptional regulator [Paenibacillus sp. FSL R10-2796]|uniref:helix-turn-helix transcriptional regulator n=1 Tax=Paenibacillus sp. FSL R10-2796 TaxID=2954663 RepID=UPI0030DB2F4C